jgi:dUTPase
MSNINIPSEIALASAYINKFMYLKIFIESNDDLKKIYIDAAKIHNEKIMTHDNKNLYIDAGFDLFSPEIFSNHIPIKVNLGICCSAQLYDGTQINKQLTNTGYYMYPRSSLSKTALRLANSVGIIDSGYRGNLIGMFDSAAPYINSHFTYSANDRHLQICAPGLIPIVVEIVETKECLGEKTLRGDGGFGSTGK